MATDLELAWAAGIFDGEGCISIGKVPPNSKNGLRNYSYRLTLKVTMGSKETVDRFSLIVGDGTSFLHQKGTDRVSDSYSFVAQSRKTAPILQALRPYLITKAQEADIAIQFLALPDCKRGGRQPNGTLGSREVTPEYLQVREELYLACAQLKSRYKFRK